MYDELIRFKLGAKVKDQISGLTGIVVSVDVWVNGCVRLGIQQKVKEAGGKVPEVYWSDQRQCKSTGGAYVNEFLEGLGKGTVKPTEGPQSDPQSYSVK